MGLRTPVVCLALLLAGCAGPGAGAGAGGVGAVKTVAANKTTTTLPPLLVSTGKTVLYSSSHKRVRFATVGWRLPLSPVAMKSGGDVMVKVSGGMEVYGLVALKDMGVLVCKPGPLGGRFYAGDRNILGVRSAVTGGRMTVGGFVQMRIKSFKKGLPYAAQFQQVPFEASIDVKQLCRAIPAKKHAGTKDDPYIGRAQGEIHMDDFPPGAVRLSINKGETLAVHDGPGGEVTHTRGPSRWGYSVVRVAQRDGWDQVAVGGGPYLLGWIPSRPAAKSMIGVLGGLIGAMVKAKTPWSLRTKKLRPLPLHHLPAGTPVQQFGVVHARLLKPGFARVISRQDGWIYVAAAVDDDVMVEGWIKPESLGVKAE